jgi:hypothetical protein
MLVEPKGYLEPFSFQEEQTMRKRQMKKLALNRETVLNLSVENLVEVQGAGKVGVWSDPPQCDPACTSQTLSCTL